MKTLTAVAGDFEDKPSGATPFKPGSFVSLNHGGSMSYFVFAERIAVTNGVDQFTQPCPMDGNAIRFGVFIYGLGGATGVVLTPQGSNDGCNWVSLTASSTLSSTFQAFESTAISYAMVRAKLATQGTGTVALALDGNTAHL